MAILNEAPKGAEVLDLGAARVARAEARTAAGKHSAYIKLAAGYIEVQPEVPLNAALLFEQNDLAGGLALLLVDADDATALLADGLTAEDLKSIIEFISGKTPGESKA